jgi:hypothetical protein
MSLARGLHPNARMNSKVAVVALVVTVAAWGTVSADVPKEKDFAACNAAAKEALKAGSASPNTAEPITKDEARAAEARRGQVPTDGAGKIADSPDPQLEGMDAQGAKNPIYQAAYRTCMRKAGF